MTNSLIPLQRIERKILLIRGQKVLLDSDLAELYGVTTKQLNQQVKRNFERFPEHFMFRLTDEELNHWRSQFVTSNPGAKMGLRRPPYAFTEHGTLQMANVLNSKVAIKVSILIIEAFLKLRELTANQSAIIQKLTEHEKQIGYLFQLMEDFVSPPKDSLYTTHKIGFLREEDAKSKGNRRAKRS